MTALRVPRAEDAEFLDRQNTSPDDAGEFGWQGYRAPGHFQRKLQSGELIREDGGSLAVVDDEGDLVGEISWIRLLNGPPPHGYCWNIGIWIAPEHRGKGHGTEAQRRLAAYLFENTYLERVEAGTEADNMAEQRSLAKAGFTREGVLRHANYRAGAWRDMVVFSKLRGE